PELRQHAIGRNRNAGALHVTEYGKAKEQCEDCPANTPVAALREPGAAGLRISRLRVAHPMPKVSVKSNDVMLDIRTMNIRRMDWNLMVALEALLEEVSVGHAAHRVGLSQPAMSHALRRLRTLLDDPLLVRVGTACTSLPAEKHCATRSRICCLGRVICWSAYPSSPLPARGPFASPWRTTQPIYCCRRCCGICRRRLRAYPFEPRPAVSVRSSQSNWHVPLTLRSRAFPIASSASTSSASLSIGTPSRSGAVIRCLISVSTLRLFCEPHMSRWWVLNSPKIRWTPGCAGMVASETWY